MIAGLLYDVLRSQDCQGAKCYTTHLFIGSRSSLVRLLRKRSPTHYNSPLFFWSFQLCSKQSHLWNQNTIYGYGFIQDNLQCHLFRSIFFIFLLTCNLIVALPKHK